jgi:ABC-type antimicrobial peptide transport system permease subunit
VFHGLKSRKAPSTQKIAKSLSMTNPNPWSFKEANYPIGVTNIMLLSSFFVMLKLPSSSEMDNQSRSWKKPINCDFLLLKIPSIFFVNKNKIQVVLHTEFVVDVAICGC